jgi:DeoR/GlpR family transcriptional regulator of sugar metabolism
VSRQPPGFALPEERRLRIAAQLRRDARVRVEDLVRQFGVSGETIRRDLQVLEERGMAQRVYGGAVSYRAPNLQQPDGASPVIRLDPKRAIAAAAAALVEPSDTVIIDTGSTAAEVARALPASFAGRVLCTSVQTAAELAARDGIEVLLSGGRLGRKGLSCSGPAAEHFFRQFFADRAFLAADGVHPRAGITGADLPDNSVRQVILGQARECYVLADHAKLGMTAVGRICDLPVPAAVITDSRADPETVRVLEQAGATVLVAPPATGLD